MWRTVTRVGEPGVGDAPARAGQLVRRDRGRGDTAAVAGRGVDGEGAPARADLEQVVLGTEPEHAAEPVDLGDARLLQGGVGALEDPAGVGHGGVEHELEEVVAQVVVVGDVAAAAGPRVAAEGVPDGVDRASQGGQPSLQAVHGGHVSRHQADHRGEVGGVPLAGGVGLRGPQRAAGGDPSPEGRVAHHHLGGEAVGGGAPERGARAPFTEGELPLGEARQARQHQAAEGESEGGRGSGLDLARHGVFLGAAAAVRLAGWTWNGVPFTQRRRACQ